MIYVNKDLVTHIKVLDEKSANYSFVYSKVERLFGFKFNETAPGFYFKGDSNNFMANWTEKSIEESEDLFLKGDDVWVRPNIEIYAGDSLIVTKYFDSLGEAVSYVGSKYPNVYMKYA